MDGCECARWWADVRVAWLLCAVAGVAAPWVLVLSSLLVSGGPGADGVMWAFAAGVLAGTAGCLLVRCRPVGWWTGVLLVRMLGVLPRTIAGVGAGWEPE